MTIMALTALLLFGFQSAELGAGRLLTPSQSQPKPGQLAERTLQALEQTQLRYEKIKDGLWVISFKGDNLEAIDVYVIAHEDMVVVSSTVQKQPSLSLEALRRLLLISFEANYSKVALDNDGDLMALTELGPDFTTETLRRAIDKVATLADSIGPVAATESLPPTVSVPASPPSERGATVPILRGVYELAYDPAKWQRQTVEGNVVQLTHHEGDAYLKVIDERVEFTLDGLRDAALANMKTAASEVRLESETGRQVNGLTVRIVRFSGTTGGARFTFLSQLYVSGDGSVQLAGWTGSNLIAEYESDFLELFAGFKKVR